MGSEDILHQLLKRVEDVNIFGVSFESPLIAALAGDHPIIVELLFERNIEIDRSSPEHGSALRYACAHSSKQIVHSLLGHGADINAYDEKHGSVLTAATSRKTYSRRGDEAIGSSEVLRAIVEFLLRHDPKVQIRECGLLAAASGTDTSAGQYYMRLLLQHDQSVVPTEAVIIMAVRKYYDYGVGSRKTLRLLLNCNCGLGITPAMLEAAKTVEKMRMLWELDPSPDTT